ncbi:MAG: hypothetical protein ACTHLO_02360 [Pseudolabrys sp.]
MSARRGMWRTLRRAALTPAAPLLVAVAALIGMGIFLLVAPKAAAGGWLAAFLFWSGIPLGGLLLMLIHALTGGRWGYRFAPEFIPSAAALPLMAFLSIPILAALPGFYPWVFGHGGVHADVHRWYLNAPFFIGRTAVAFVGWTALAFVLPRLAGPTQTIIAGLGLIFHGVAVSILGYDWVLSLAPHFTSSSFGATLAFAQLASALAWTAIVARDNGDPAFGDLGGLLLAALLGLTYVNFMALLIVWYGDVPERVNWFVERTHALWIAFAVLAFLLVSVVPIFALFLGRWRRSPRALRPIAVVVLAGLALFDIYLVVPAFDPLALGAAAVAIVAIGALLVAFLAMPWARAPLRQWRMRHGR